MRSGFQLLHRRWIALLLPLVVAAVVVGLLYDPHSPEERVRAVCRDLLEACWDRDLEEVWDLHCDRARDLMGGSFENWRAGEPVRFGESVVVLPLPDSIRPGELDDEELFVRIARWALDRQGERPGAPWCLSPELLRDLRQQDVSFPPEPPDDLLNRPLHPVEEGELAEVVLVPAHPRGGNAGLTKLSLLFLHEGWGRGSWGLYGFRCEYPPPASPALTPPPTIDEVLEEVEAASDRGSDPLRLDAALSFAETVRVLRACAARGRPCAVLETVVAAPATGMSVYSGVGIVLEVANFRFGVLGLRLPVDLPGRDFEPGRVDAIVELPVSRLGPADRNRLQSWLGWLFATRERPVVLLAPRAGTLVTDAAWVAEMLPSTPHTLLVAEPGSDEEESPPGGVRLNGVPLSELPAPPDLPSPTPEPSEKTLRPLRAPPPPSRLWPPVPTDHPALRRVIRRR